MERLILSYLIGDYHFSADAHLPVVFSSKEEFLISLEDTVRDIHKKWHEYQSIILKENEKSSEIYKLNREKPENLKIIQEYLQNKMELDKKQKEITQFEFAGQKLCLEDFVDMTKYYTSKGKDKNFYFISPTVQTIDEYFMDVENKIQTKPTKP